jgi:hypothetical protein
MNNEGANNNIITSHRAMPIQKLKNPNRTNKREKVYRIVENY